MSRTTCTSLIAIFILMGLFYCWYGRVFLDAGFYLNASRDVYQGRMPYRDFFFVQGPVYPYVYGLPLMLTGYQVLNARLLSLLLGSLTLIFASRIAFRSAGFKGSIITLAAIATVPSQAYFFSSVKLYSLAAMLVTAAFAMLGSGLHPRIRHTTGLLLAILAAATRLTLLPAALVVAVFIIADAKLSHRRFPWLPLGIGLLTGSLIALPFLLADAEALMYFLIGIHTSAEGGQYLFSFWKQLKVLLKLLLYYPVLTISLGSVIALPVIRRFRPVLIRLEWAMLAAVATVTLGHITANWFSLDYQSVIVPLTGAFAGSVAGRWSRSVHFSRKTLAAAMLLTVVAGAGTYRQYIWSEKVSVVRHLSLIASIVRQKSSPGGSVAACSAVFAMEAGRPVTAAFGGAPFTYTPDWDDAHCRRYGGMNNRMIVDMISRKEPAVLLFEPDSFSVGSPGFFAVPEALQQEIFQAIHQHYRVEARFRNLGNGDVSLLLYTPVGMDTGR